MSNLSRKQIHYFINLNRGYPRLIVDKIKEDFISLCPLISTVKNLHQLRIGEEAYVYSQEELREFLLNSPQITQFFIAQDFILKLKPNELRLKKRTTPPLTQLICALAGTHVNSLRLNIPTNLYRDSAGTVVLEIAQEIKLGLRGTSIIEFGLTINLAYLEAEELVFALRQILQESAISHLDLSNNDFSQNVEKVLAALVTLPPLQYLNLSENGFTIEQAILIIQTTQQVESINLSTNIKEGQYTEDKVEAMVTAICNFGKQVILDNNELGKAVEKRLRERHLQALESSLPLPRPLQTLTMEHVPLCLLNGPLNPPLAVVSATNASLSSKEAQQGNASVSGQTDFWRQPATVAQSLDNKDKGPTAQAMR